MEIKQGDFGAIALAFLGDSVIETKVREILVLTHDENTGILTEIAHSYTCANSQSDRLNKILPILTEEENEVFLRARNHKSKHPHSTSAVRYKMATGFEAIFGWLKLKGDEKRIDELFRLAFDDLFDK